uniref:Uncharacterized protein n=1 Tax=Rhizophora mucronata TaxID=61149 RepID=A0A2P2NYR5_RHIMU
MVKKKMQEDIMQSLNEHAHAHMHAHSSTHSYISNQSFNHWAHRERKNFIKRE